MLRINDVQNATVAASNPLERDFGLSVNPTKTELLGQKCYPSLEAIDSHIGGWFWNAATRCWLSAAG